MFTVKFCSFFESSENVEVNISCPHYIVYSRNDGSKTITLYKDFTSTDGVEYWVAKESLSFSKPHFHVCYVENSAGKTINKF